MTLPASIRVNVRVPFPTSVQGASFISLSKVSGIWNIVPNYTLLAQAAPAPTSIMAFQDLVSGIWNYTFTNNLTYSALNTYRLITATGAAPVLTTDVVLLVNAATGAVTLNLPTSASRNGAPVIIKDYARVAYTYNITAVPASGETIDGLSGTALATAGLAVINVDGGSLVLWPLASGGWYSV